MSSPFQIDPKLEIPIYQQLVDRVRSDIKSGALPAGAQLPTVRELAEELGLARGTIKRAYDELEQAGLVEKVQGRGTFVSYRPERPESRKDRAMLAIDQLFEQLGRMGFSINEMGIFLKLKLQELAAQQANLKVAVVECNPEVLSQLCDQLRQIAHLDIYTFLLEEVLTYPYRLQEDMDLVITTREHAEDLGKMMADSRKIAKIALQPQPGCVTRIAKLRPEGTVGILCRSLRFGELLSRVCGLFAPQAPVAAPRLMEGDCAAYLAGKAAVLVPGNYKRYADEPTLRALREFAVHGQVIPCFYQIDEGSLMYLKEKIQELLDKDKL